MRTVIATAAGLAAGILVGAAVGHPAAAGAQQQAPASYLVIGKCGLPAGISPAAAIQNATRDAAAFKQTGEYRSVRLFVHSYGPELATYHLMEPKSWQSIESGFNKVVAANPAVMTRPFECATHSDNILTEVPIP